MVRVNGLIRYALYPTFFSLDSTLVYHPCFASIQYPKFGAFIIYCKVVDFCSLSSHVHTHVLR